MHRGISSFAAFIIISICMYTHILWSHTTLIVTLVLNTGVLGSSLVLYFSTNSPSHVVPKDISLTVHNVAMCLWLFLR